MSLAPRRGQPYVAEWRADAGLPNEHLRSITVHITEAGACYVMAETSDGSEGGNGRRSLNEVGGIDIKLEDGDTAKGKMLDADTLVISGDGDTVKFTRQ